MIEVQLALTYMKVKLQSTVITMPVQYSQSTPPPPLRSTAISSVSTDEMARKEKYNVRVYGELPSLLFDSRQKDCKRAKSPHTLERRWPCR